MASGKVRIVAKNQEATRRVFEARESRRVHAEATRDLAGWHRAGRRTNDDEHELLNISWRILGPQFGGGAIINIRNTKAAH
jgi:hypothetical protein